MVTQLSFLKSQKFTLLLITLLIVLSIVLFNSFKVHAQTVSSDPTQDDQILGNFESSSPNLLASPSASTAPSAHTNDIFLKIDGIPGESTDAKHKDEIVIDTFSFGASQHGSGGGAGKVKFNEFNITKKLDKTSPKLFLAVALGQHIKEATLSARKAGGNQQDFLKIKLMS